MLTNEIKNTELTKSNKSWIDFRAQTKIGLLANIDRPCNVVVDWQTEQGLHG